jgi:hypothetical protein
MCWGGSVRKIDAAIVRTKAEIAGTLSEKSVLSFSASGGISPPILIERR